MGQLSVLGSVDLLRRIALIVTVGLLSSLLGELRRVAHLYRARRCGVSRLVYFVRVLREHDLARLVGLLLEGFLS